MQIKTRQTGQLNAIANQILCPIEYRNLVYDKDSISSHGGSMGGMFVSKYIVITYISSRYGGFNVIAIVSHLDKTSCIVPCARSFFTVFPVL